MTYYFLQSRLNGKIANVGHSKNDETGEIYFKFIDKKKCRKLMQDEMKISPEYDYRIMKVIERIEIGAWIESNKTGLIKNPESFGGEAPVKPEINQEL